MGFFDLADVADTEKVKKLTIHNCDSCKLYQNCNSPKVGAVRGEGRLGIMVLLGETFLAQEGSKGAKEGSHYNYLRRRFKEVGIGLARDCWTVNAIRCYVADTDKIGAKAMSGCASLLQKDIKRLGPKAIVVTDELAWNVLLSNRMSGRANGTLWDYAGSVIPDQELKTWIYPFYSTHLLIEAENEIERKKKEYGPHYKGSNRFEPHSSKQYTALVENLSAELPVYEYENLVQSASNVDQAIQFMDKAMEWPWYAFDYETSGLAWHNPKQKIHSVSFSNGKVSYAMLWYPENKTFMAKVRQLLTNKAIKIAQNKGFERSWSIGRAGVEPTNLIHDPMLMAHVWRNLAPTGLKFLLYREYGVLGYDEEMDEYIKASKEDESKFGKNAINRMFEAPVRKVLLYVGLDSLFTYWLAKFYLGKMDKEHMMPGYKLLARAERPLTHMHLNGLYVNKEAINKWKGILTTRIHKNYMALMDSDLIRNKWSGKQFNPGSDADVRFLVYTILKLKPEYFTKSGLPSVDGDALEELRDDIPNSEELLEYRRWAKALTFIEGIEREMWDSIIHPYFSLNNVDSYRSASQKINLQNIPKHDLEVMHIIRDLILPHPGQKLASCDYAQLEVRANTAITKDKGLTKAVVDGWDMHSTVMRKTFFFPEDYKNKLARQYIKSQVFRLFYGGSGEQMGKALWKIMRRKNATELLGHDIIGHVKAKGIVTEEQWVDHCKRVEKWLWSELFTDYMNWRSNTYSDYLKNGYMYYPNGFTYQGVCSRNSLLNGPGQGAGFHVNLNAIIGVFEEMEAKKMKTKMVVEIHDDELSSVEPGEEEEYKKILFKHMVAKQDEYSPWMKGVPLEVEYSCAEVDRPWSEMKEVGVLHG